MGTGKVILAGAGCGAYDLASLRAVECLKRCDCVVYDALTDRRLLDFAPENAEKISVGKRSGRHSITQDKINDLLVEKALSGQTVVRLKGGDPFVFGRGGEEILALQKKKISYSIVPGITSAVAVPELAGIPVTHRRMSRSFHVITGHTADELIPENLQKYACLEGTLVFLMGLKNLRRIVGGLLSGGMRGDTPAAVISCGGMSEQRVVTDSLDRIADTADSEDLAAPAVIVVGKTVSLDLSAADDRTLGGVTVTVTGTRKFTDKLSRQLSNLGADVRVLNSLRVKAYEHNPRLDSALADISAYSWLVLTSANGAEIFISRLRKLKIDIRRLSSLRIAVIGSGTADFLEQYGIFPELIPEKYTSAALAEALTQSVSAGENVLILRAERGSPELTEILGGNGIQYNDIKTYDVENIIEKRDDSVIETDFLTFASPSGVDAFFDSGFTVSAKTKILCIGEITLESLKKRGIKGITASETQTAAGIAETIIQEVEK